MATELFSQYTAEASFFYGNTRAAPQALERNRHRLEKALAEVDGLFNGLRFLDKTEPRDPSRSPSMNLHYGFSQDTLGAALDNMSEPQNHSPHALHGTHHIPNIGLSSVPEGQKTGGERAKFQWSALRNVRDATAHYYQILKDIAERSGNPAILDLFKSYANAKELREIGVLTFRDSLTGIKPTSLKAIWAFCSLSYVISQLLYAENRICKEEILAGVRIWRDSIQDTQDRKTFDELAEKIWPEAKHHLVTARFDEWHASRCKAARETLRNGHKTAPAVDRLEEMSSVLSSRPGIPAMAIVSSSPPDLPAIPAANTATSSQPSHVYDQAGEDSMGEFFDCINDGSFDMISWSSLQLAEHCNSVFCFADTLIPDALEPGGEPQGSTQTCKTAALQDTMVFLAVLLFFQSVGDKLLYMLSGNGLTVKNVKSGVTFTRDQSKFEKRVRREFFKPLSGHAKQSSATSTGLLSMAKKCVKVGYLRGIDDVQRFLVTIAKEMMSDDDLHQFCKIIYGLPPTQNSPPPSPSEFVCDNCKRPFKTHAGLIKHRKAEHGRRETLHCPAQGCEFIGSAARRDNLRQHFLNVHKELALPPSLCERGRRPRRASAAGPVGLV